jgi:hypothetical protein
MMNYDGDDACHGITSTSSKFEAPRSRPCVGALLYAFLVMIVDDVRTGCLNGDVGVQNMRYVSFQLARDGWAAGHDRGQGM